MRVESSTEDAAALVAGGIPRHRSVRHRHSPGVVNAAAAATGDVPRNNAVGHCQRPTGRIDNASAVALTCGIARDSAVRHRQVASSIVDAATRLIRDVPRHGAIRDSQDTGVRDSSPNATCAASITCHQCLIPGDFAIYDGQDTEVPDASSGGKARIPSCKGESAQLRRDVWKHRQDQMIVVPVDLEIAFTIKDDVVVDFDSCSGHHRRRSIAVKRVRTTAFSDGVADTLLGAWEYATHPAGAAGSTIAPHARATTGLVSTSVQRQGRQQEKEHESKHGVDST